MFEVKVAINLVIRGHAVPLILLRPLFRMLCCTPLMCTGTYMYLLCQAYRELAKVHHPDKVQGDEEKIKSEKIFQEVAEAYEVLGDEELRAK